MTEINSPLEPPDIAEPGANGITQLLIDEYVKRLSRPGPDGTYYRSFIADWLYFERPMLDRFKGNSFNIQFQGPPVKIDGTEYPLGGFVQRCQQIQWARIGPVLSFQLREKLRQAVDQCVEDWLADQSLSFGPAYPAQPFSDREAADAEAEQEVRAFARPLGNIGDDL